LAPLPTTSNNGFGTVTSPDTVTTTYIFTAGADQCATTNLTVNQLKPHFVNVPKCL
jgi:hypothetical protein